MKQKVYVVTLEGEPQYITKDLSKIEKQFNDWYDAHYDDFGISRDYYYWLEDRKYPNTDDGEEQAWRDYVSAQFDNGVWGDYAWWELYLEEPV